ncbi:MAG: sulfatase-like hydrolase/transferase [Pirellulaceae bacterium]
MEQSARRQVKYARCVLLLWMAVLVHGTGAVAGQAATLDRPNLVFVLSDQQSWDMLGCYGNRDIQTPNLDKLAREGLRFNHCVSCSPVCTPYRSILLSGQHPLNSGAFQNDLQMLPGNGTYLAERLRDAGYRLGYYGKWHLYGGERNRGIPSGPYRYGFDQEFLVNNCTLVFDAARAYYWDQEGKNKQMYGDWEPYAQTRQALEYIDRHGNEPFALFLSWHPPHNWGVAHAGYDAPQDLLDLYDPAKLTLRPTVRDTPEVRLAYQGHMAMISGIDRAFGQLMQKLDERGLANNTIVVFTSDHGDMLRSYDWPNNKGRAEHLSSRVPLLVRWPARLQPGTTDLLIGTFDLMPTLLGLLELPVPETCQGRDASAAMLQQRDDGVEAQPLFFLPLNWRGVYTKRFTYSVALHGPGEPNIPGGSDTFNVLYDRQADPWETRNLFHDPAFQDVRQQLHAQTLDLMQRFGDTGLNNDELLKRTVCAEDLRNVLTGPAKRPPGWEGRLRGRPVDVLKNAPVNAVSAAADLPSVELKLTGDWTVEVRVAGTGATTRELSGTFTVAPPQPVAVNNEHQAALEEWKPAQPGWARRKLSGLQDGGCSSRFALLPGSVRVTAADEATKQFELEKDFKVDLEWGAVGRMPEGGIGPTQAVTVSYEFALRRLDSLVRTAQNELVLRPGQPHIAMPLPPTLLAGEERLANIWLPEQLTKLTPDHLFPILETSFPEPPARSPTEAERLLPKTVAKLRSGEPLKILAWGDSVTEGYLGEDQWQAQFVRRLKTRFPKANVTLVTVGWGAHNSLNFLEAPAGHARNYSETVLAARPDLIVSEFVNDCALDVPTVERLYAQFLSDFRRLGMEWIILTPHYSTFMGVSRERDLDEDPRACVKTMRDFATANGVALADAAARYGRLWRQGIPYSTLMVNTANHPDARGMAIFADSLLALFP